MNSAIDLRSTPKISCAACNGTGSQPYEAGPAGATWTEYRDCPHCKGRGWFIYRMGE